MRRKLTVNLLLSIIFLTALAIGGCFDNDKNLQLLDAAESGDLPTVKLLIQHGVPINYTSSAKFGWTPLIGAIFHHQTNVVYYLVQSGAVVNLADKNGVTPLMWLASWRDDAVPLVNYLIARRANLDAKDKYGATVFAAAKGDPPATKLIEVLENAKLEQENKSRK